MKAVLMSIQPYWVFLIIARKMGWHIDKEKTIEVRKNFPKDQDWNRSVEIYCSKDKKSFSQIPKKYQPLMKRFLGKVTSCKFKQPLKAELPIDSTESAKTTFLSFVQSLKTL